MEVRISDLLLHYSLLINYYYPVISQIRPPPFLQTSIGYKCGGGGGGGGALSRDLS